MRPTVLFQPVRRVISFLQRELLIYLYRPRLMPSFSTLATMNWQTPCDIPFER